jgi:hypothetical protein
MSECAGALQMIVNLSAVLTHGVQELVKFVCNEGGDPEGAAMSELRSVKPNEPSERRATSDAHALAQVEKWMAMIRQIGPQPEIDTQRTASSEDRLPCA